ncbi:hydrogenase [Methanocella sp. CWC-04]|uniref:Hydrogenase n=1 Tax=Methanooceanicella nereidis TaxID=2052831 RepID=A0AAP2W5U9_9EURY|nr:4Fe-4S dicluster domain-containing protein [Methanocella sp. CWC-04]MCD1295950.1 hydrogenase [Methanocella sp. CWC-04]
MKNPVKAFAGLIANFFRKPVTIEENYGFLSDTFRWLPRRDDEKCTGCGACYERCSSGATHIHDVQEERTVCIDSLNCIFCGRCADACPESALELSFEPKTDDEKKVREEMFDIEGGECPHSLIRPKENKEASLEYLRRISLAHEQGEDGPCTKTMLPLQRCSVCGEIMPETSKHLEIVKKRALENLQPETAKIVEEDMKLYLTACVSCRQKYSLIWNTHPRKYI